MLIMPTLHDVQKAMHGHILRSEQGIAAMFAGGAVQERLDVYRNTVVLTLTRALRIAFPVVHKLVGGPPASISTVQNSRFSSNGSSLREALPTCPMSRSSNGLSTARCTRRMAWPSISKRSGR
jgi:hypothetical protein